MTGTSPARPEISFDSELLQVGAGSRGAQAISWCEITEIRAFKRDLWSVDLVCFLLRTRSGRTLELDEDQPGFPAALAELETRFPGVKGWEESVIQPPFASRETTLYRQKI